MKNFILGIDGPINDRLINPIFCLTKRYIYITKCKEKELPNLIKYHEIELRLDSMKSKNQQILEFKWKPIMPVL